jgi:hypothetical protein
MPDKTRFVAVAFDKSTASVSWIGAAELKRIADISYEEGRSANGDRETKRKDNAETLRARSCAEKVAARLGIEERFIARNAMENRTSLRSE